MFTTKLSKLVKRFKIQPGEEFRIRDHVTDLREIKQFKKFCDGDLKSQAQAVIRANLERLSRAQEMLYANHVYSVLIIFQGMDTAGKDSMIEHVMSGVNPQGCSVVSFKRPTQEELDHDFLWRCHRQLPERGRIGIFNRSYYEEVLIVRVHPELLENQRLPQGKRGRKFWRRRYEYINNFEQYLVENGTMILKFFLNISKEEQKKRLIERLTKPEKHWKFSMTDVIERKLWDKYSHAYEQAITATSTEWAPWYVIPSDHKWAARAVVSAIISHQIESLGVKPPRLSDQQRRDLARARQMLDRE